MTKLLPIALEYIAAGLSVLPVSAETKIPLVEKDVNWKSESFTGPNRGENAKRYFTRETKDLGIGLACGTVSENLYVFDFDNHFGDAEEIFKSFCQIAEVEEILQEINPYIVSTKSGGFHLCVKTHIPHNTEKLARRNNEKEKKIEALIESKAEGGYVVTYPTRGYTVIGGNATGIPKITEDQFEILHSAAISFNEYVPEDKIARNTTSGDSGRPGDIYDGKTEAIQEAKALLTAAGWWSSRNGVYWRRPGKDKGVSATFGKIAANVFYNFSSSATVFEDRKAYTPFQLLALLKYNGNFTEAAKELAKRYNVAGFEGGKYNKIKNKVRDAIRKGQKLTSGEINDIAESMNVSVNLVAGEVTTLQKKYGHEWEFDKKKDIEKAEIYLHSNYEFRLDVISKMPEMRKSGEQWEDLNVNTLYREIQHEGIKFKLESIKSLLKSDFVESYNPFEAYFNSLPAWDGEDYINKLAGYVKIDGDHLFFSKMLEKALVRNIACALIPTYYNRVVFVLQADKQEIGKTYFIMFLNPFGSKYYTDEPLKENKDSRFALTENFIYNLEELDGLSRMELSHMKATISTRGVKDRVAYGTHKEYFPRCCSFWGSTNRQEFLTDDRNTRWLVFTITSINWKYSKDIDINKVWSQAWHLFKQKDYIYDLTPAEAGLRDVMNEEYRVIDYEHSILLKYFAPDENGFMTNSDILSCMNTAIGGAYKLQTNPQKMGRILAALDFKRARRDNQRGWKLRYLNGDTPGPVIDYSAAVETKDLPF